MRPRLLSAVCLTLTLTLSGVAPAAEDTRAEARERFDRGLRLFKAGDDGGALAEFQRAYELTQHPLVLFNIAQIQAKRGAAVEALASFDKLLANPGVLDAERVEQARALRAEQLGRIAEVELDVQVPNTAIELDGVEIARTPLTGALRVPSGQHVLGVFAPGHQPVRRSITVAGQSRTKLAIPLVPLEGKPALIEVKSKLRGAELYVDGELVGRTPLAASIAVAPGTRTLELRRKGYTSAKQSLTLGAGTTGSVMLDPTPAGAPSTELALELSEPDTLIFVDDEPRGTYSKPIPLPEGEHLLRVERRDFLPFQRVVTVAPTGVTRVRIELEPTAEFRASYADRTSSRRTWSWITIGGGLAIAGGSAGFLVWNRSEESKAKDEFEREFARGEAGGDCQASVSRPPECDVALDLALDNLESVRGREKFGWVGLGVGAAVGVLGTVLLLTNDDPDRYEPRSESDVFGRLKVTPSAWADARGGGVGLLGSF
jgi:hypothetical protein